MVYLVLASYAMSYVEPHETLEDAQQSMLSYICSAGHTELKECEETFKKLTDDTGMKIQEDVKVKDNDSRILESEVHLTHARVSCNGSPFVWIRLEQDVKNFKRLWPAFFMTEKKPNKEGMAYFISNSFSHAYSVVSKEAKERLAEIKSKDDFEAMLHSVGGNFSISGLLSSVAFSVKELEELPEVESSWNFLKKTNEDDKYFYVITIIRNGFYVNAFNSEEEAVEGMYKEFSNFTSIPVEEMREKAALLDGPDSYCCWGLTDDKKIRAELNQRYAKITGNHERPLWIKIVKDGDAIEDITPLFFTIKESENGYETVESSFIYEDLLEKYTTGQRDGIVESVEIR